MKFRITFPGEADEPRDFSKQVGNVTISDNINALGTHLRFEVVHGIRDKNIPIGEIPIGSKVYVEKSDPDPKSILETYVAKFKKQRGDYDPYIFSGIVVSKSYSGSDKFVYEAYDYGFYLNKGMVSIQFNNIDATTAITELCRRQNISVGVICDIPTKIRKIYHANLVIDVIRDILEQAEMERGEKYNLEMAQGYKLTIKKCTDLALFMTAVQVNKIDTLKPGMFPLDLDYTLDMNDLKTEVIIVTGSERYVAARSNAKVEIPERDAKMFKAKGLNYRFAEDVYGVIPEVIRTDLKNQSQIDQLAKKRIEEVGKLGSTIKVKLLGDSRVKSGRIINFNNPENVWSLRGKYYVKSCTHVYTSDLNHTMDLELEFLDPNPDQEVTTHVG